MLKVLEYIRQVLETDDVLIENLSKYGEPGEELPAVAYGVAPNDMSMPYIVTNVQPGSESNPALDRMIYTIDIYVDNGDIIKAQILADRVDFLFDRRKLPVDIGVGMWRDGKFPIINEDDPAVQHFHVSFTVRHNRIY
jgi:hypothetical protein